jgi:hypothetical protein
VTEQPATSRASTLELALDYAQRGWPVFPCHPETKAPLPVTGFKAATTNSQAILRMWARMPDALIGVPMGPASGVWALDIDVDPGKAVDGETAISALGSLPSSISQRTPRGGRHILYRWDEARPVRNTASRIAPGVDTRGDGGFIVVAGSVRADGAAYTWEVPPDHEPADAPEWLYAALAKPVSTNPPPARIYEPDSSRGYGAAALREECERVANAPEGERNDTLNRAAFSLAQLVAGGELQESIVRTELIAAADAAGLRGAEVAKTIESGFTAGQQQPRERPTSAPVPARLSPSPPNDQGQPGWSFRVVRYSEIPEDLRKTWLVQDMLGAGELSVVFGGPGSGKSVIVGDLGFHVAAGADWFGRTVEAGLVVYVAAERAALMWRRARAWRLRHGIEDIPLVILSGSFDLTTTSAQTGELAQFCRFESERLGLPTRLIVVDTLQRVFGGENENDAASMGALVNNLATLQQETGAHVLVIHHTPVLAPDRMRGHGALTGAADSTFLVEKGSGVRTLSIVKSNDTAEELKIRYSLESVTIHTDEDGQETAAPVVVEAEDAGPELCGRRRITGHAGKVLQAMGRLADAGRDVEAPPIPGLPSGVRVVTIPELREQAYEVGLCAAKQPVPGDEKAIATWKKTRATAFSRGFQTLQDQGIVRTEGGFAWIIDRTAAA